MKGKHGIIKNPVLPFICCRRYKRSPYLSGDASNFSRRGYAIHFFLQDGETGGTENVHVLIVCLAKPKKMACMGSIM